AAPLGLVMLLIALDTALPRYFLERASGMSTLGIFAALSHLMVSGGMVVGAMGQVVSPRLADLGAAGNWTAFHRLLTRILLIAGAVGVAGALVAAVAGRPILLLL